MKQLTDVIKTTKGGELIFYCPLDQLEFKGKGYDNPVFWADKVANCPTCGGKCWEQTIKITMSQYVELQSKNSKNTLVTIGWTGTKTAYLNISKEEAIERYLKDNPDCKELVTQDGFVNEFEFNDEFGVYDAWKLKPTNL
ncbi:MAG: hypothetical protein GY928_34175 [Colwellia sp.]|nr:hypothetical protein [Colwellia sp.]